MAATEVPRPRVRSPVDVPEAKTQHCAAAPVRVMSSPSAAERAMSAVMHVAPEQVPAGHGLRATRNRREGRMRGGNHRGHSTGGFAGRQCPNVALPPRQCSLRVGTARQPPQAAAPRLLGGAGTVAPGVDGGTERPPRLVQRPDCPR